MTAQTFQKAATLITACFPDKKFEFDVYFELLRDLKDQFFLRAVRDLCVDKKELYPGTNIVALLRERTLELSRVPQELKMIGEGQWKNQPPPEFKELIKKLSRKMGVNKQDLPQAPGR